MNEFKHPLYMLKDKFDHYLFFYHTGKRTKAKALFSERLTAERVAKEEGKRLDTKLYVEMVGYKI